MVLPFDILLLGPPGAGKGTQGVLLSERLGLPKFATGDLLRDAVARGTPLGQRAKAVMESGSLVSDDLILEVVAEELDKPAAARGVVFDGVVRTIPQAEGTEKLLADRGRRINGIRGKIGGGHTSAPIEGSASASSRRSKPRRRLRGRCLPGSAPATTLARTRRRRRTP